jgi:hypothetical protein
MQNLLLAVVDVRRSNDARWKPQRLEGFARGDLDRHQASQ